MFFILMIFTIKKLYISLEILQQQYYSVVRYLKIKRNNFFMKQFIVLCFIVLTYILKNNFLFFITVFFLLLDNVLIKKNRIIKLKMTKRIIRIFLIHFLFLIALFFLINHYIIEVRLFLIFVTINLYDFIFLIPFILEKIIETIINNYYFNKARNKLKKSKVKIIAITGSYAKTSIKEYLYNLLKIKYNVLKTPKSYNTLLGVCMVINNNYLKNYDYFIIEVGVDKKNTMRKFLKLFTPDITILSGITYQHLSTFKNLQNIIKEKMIMINACQEMAFINSSNKDILSYIKCPNILFNNEELITIDNNSFIFNETVYHTLLHGKHFFVNLVCAIKVATYLNIEKEKIRTVIENIKNVEHRFELKKHSDYYYIDDAYNSNIYSFLKALESFEGYDKFKIIITPGLIELADKSYEFNKIIANRCFDVCDLVLLIKNNKAFVDFNNSKLKVFDSFKDAFEFADSIKKDKIILIENDVPDFYVL